MAATARSEGKARSGLDLLRRAASLVSAPENAAPLSVFLLTRCVFVLITYFAVIMFNGTFQSAHPSLTHALLPAWDRWDTAWYIAIAERGYHWKTAAGTSPTAFFPLYSVAIALTHDVLRRSMLVSALLVSNVACIAALLYLWRLTAWELGREVANRTVLYISVFPTALFFFAGYSESLFLALSVVSFFHLRRRRWLVAGVFAALASATRVTGVLLVIPLLYEYARDRNFSPREMLSPGLLGPIVAPLGLLAFMAYLQSRVGDALAFSHQQAGWQKQFTVLLWTGPLRSIREILQLQPNASFFQAHNVMNLSLTLLALIATVYAARSLPTSYTLYLVGFWILTLSDPATANGYPVPLVSFGRYVLTLFPLFMATGRLGISRSFHDGYLVLGTAWMAVLTARFVTGGWVV